MDQYTAVQTLLDDIDQLLGYLVDAELRWADWVAAVAPENRSSARNLVHYWAIRQHDLRDLQARLAGHGLSSLGRIEPHVEATLRQVRSAISALLGDGWRPPPRPAVGADDGAELLQRRASALLGPRPEVRVNRIMVTLPSEAAQHPEVVRGLVDKGMNVARINCAHDDAQAWRAMAAHVRQVTATTGRPCHIAMDLAGPKLRTGPLEPGPRCIKLHPRRNALGLVIAPAQAWLTTADGPARPGMPRLSVSRDWLARRRDGDVVLLHDTRGSKRRLTLTAASPGGFVATAWDTTYLATGTALEVEGADDRTDVGELPQLEQSLLLHTGNILTLTRDCGPAVPDADAPRIGCTLPEVFEHVKTGDRVLFDDGKIGGEVISVGPADAGLLRVRITHAGASGSRLRAAKGINLPDTALPIPALTDKDLADLAVAAELADFVELSFVRDPSDVERLLIELDALGAAELGVVLKIETRAGFEHLPQLLLTAMRRSRVGVMIARGDLAVECGYERLAELQEEILWLCEAAHLPVIWATQVLEQLAKSGNPSRAEISDAAMGEGAECVMLNKGPYIDAAVVALDDILRRMSAHHYKKNQLMPSLHSWKPVPPRISTG